MFLKYLKFLLLTFKIIIKKFKINENITYLCILLFTCKDSVEYVLCI